MEVLGWMSAGILILTLLAQIQKQWRSRDTRGVSSWLFIGQSAASLGFFLYSWQVGNQVFIIVNGILLVISLMGLMIHRLGCRPTASTSRRQTRGSPLTRAADERRQRALLCLASLCRGELSAAEAYEAAIGEASLARFTEVLQDCQRSHEERVRLLSHQIRALGGKVPYYSGGWGSLESVLERAVDTYGVKVAIELLEDGEEHGLRDYRS